MKKMPNKKETVNIKVAKIEEKVETHPAFLRLRKEAYDKLRKASFDTKKSMAEIVSHLIDFYLN